MADEKKEKKYKNEYTLQNALVKGDVFTRLNCLVCGIGNMARGQVVKGLLSLSVEVAFVVFMIKRGLYNLSMLPSLGDNAQQEVWNEKKGIYEYTAGDNSVLILLYGIVAVCLCIAFIIFWTGSMKSAYKAYYLKKNGKHVNNFSEDMASLLDKNLYRLLLTGPVAGVLIFTILPLIFMISMAFTNYSKQDDHMVLFDWVGLKVFGQVLNLNSSIGQTFWGVLAWTIVWAFFATFLNYFFGMILAIVINRKDTHWKGFWRFCFVLSIAVPQFVSLLIMRTILQPQGAVNVMLQNAGLIKSALPFFTNTTWARITVIVINLWVGIPFTLIQVTGILQNIPGELYEAAKVDGAGAVTIFFKITLPYMLFVTTPYLITTFMNNINNFNVIYLLSKGEPVPVGRTAGKTDLLITWLYKLTIDNQYFNIGAAIGIMTFIVMAVLSLVTYRRSGSYKNEEGMS